MLEMAKLAPMLKELAKDVGVGGHDGSRSDDGKLIQFSGMGLHNRP